MSIYRLLDRAPERELWIDDSTGRIFKRSVEGGWYYVRHSAGWAELSPHSVAELENARARESMTVAGEVVVAPRKDGTVYLGIEANGVAVAFTVLTVETADSVSRQIAEVTREMKAGGGEPFVGPHCVLCGSEEPLDTQYRCESCAEQDNEP